jgi:hypothetical protein
VIKKVKPLNILIIDDDEAYVKELKYKARDLRIILKHFQTLEESKEYLQSNEGKFIAGVILDVSCIKNKGQVPDSNFITAALDYFNLNHPRLPKAVLTGVKEHFAVLQRYYDRDRYKIFEKGDGEEDILKYLQEKALPSVFVQISQALPDVIEVFEKEYLDTDALNDFIECFKHIKALDTETINANLVRLRRILENIFIKIGKFNPTIVPPEFNKEKLESSNIINHIQWKYYGERNIITQFCWSVFSIPSSHAAHPNPIPEYSPTKYTVQSLFFALCDLLLWFKGILDNQSQ